MTKKYTLSEVAQHKTKDDLWFVIHGKVYDVTKFGDDHPGGVQSLVDEAGTDATNAFEDVGHSDDARKTLEEYYIGDLEVVSVTPADLPSASIPPTKEVPASEPASSPDPQPTGSSPKGFFSNNIVLAILSVAVTLTIAIAWKKFPR